jgi:D-arabinose 1-dehydrogenase-like Zn-dependent alcohol dehydrogenase
VGVGVYVDSCRDCKYCHERREIYCEKGLVPTFNGFDKDGTVTKGGYSSYIVVHERYIFFRAWRSLLCQLMVVKCRRLITNKVALWFDTSSYIF